MWPWHPQAQIAAGRPHSLPPPKQERQKSYPALGLTLSLPSGWPWLLARCPMGSKEPQGTCKGGPCRQESWGLAGLAQSLIIVTARVSVSILPAFGQKKKGKRRERREWRERAEGRL